METATSQESQETLFGDRQSIKDLYIGEKHNFIRNGYGVYVYENKYFRYEGEWKNGKKHGHGKLKLKDGTYYEGEFVDGEISGHGYKFFAASKSKYVGQFVNGEMQGQGVMTYKDGSIYEGQWHRNKRHGYGIFRTSSKAMYEGTFHGHLRQGMGTQTYDGLHTLSNGDRYEGYWVMDKRHGHGELFCHDGSHYVGQFAGDLFHGEGKLQHTSGITYIGQWKYGFPVRIASKLAIIVESTPMIIQQGQLFTIHVECQDEEGNLVVEDEGRELQVSAGFKYFPPKQGVLLFDVIEDVAEKPIPTPFGYEVVSYPLTDQVLEEDALKGEKISKGFDKEQSGSAESTENGKNVSTIEEDGAKGQKGVHDAESTAESYSIHEPCAESTGEVSSDFHPLESVDQTVSTTEGVIPLPPPVSTHHTEGGVVEWKNLQLAPPPPMYRPFAAMEEEAAKRVRKGTIKDRFDRKSEHEIKESKSKKTLDGNLQFKEGEYVLMVNDVTNPPFLGRHLEPAFLLLKLEHPKKQSVSKRQK